MQAGQHMASIKRSETPVSFTQSQTGPAQGARNQIRDTFGLLGSEEAARHGVLIGSGNKTRQIHFPIKPRSSHCLWHYVISDGDKPGDVAIFM